MATAPFAALQTRLNAAVMLRLPDATCSISGGPAAAALVLPGFENMTFDGPGPAGSSPSVMLAAASVPDRPAGLRLVIQTGPAAGNYKVTGHEPDGSGLVTLHLTKTT